MKIKSLHIENFKSLEDFSLEDLGNLNVFIGKNNSGKSAILEAIKATKYILNESPIDLRELVTNNDYKRKNIVIKFTLVPSKLERESIINTIIEKKYIQEIVSSQFITKITYELTTHFDSTDPSDSKRLFFKKIETNGANGGIIDLFEWENIRKEPNAFDASNQQSIYKIMTSSERILSSWGGGFSQIILKMNDERFFYLYLFGKFIENLEVLDPARFSDRDSQLHGSLKLDSNGRNLQAVLNTLAGSEPSKFDQIKILLYGLIPEIVNVLTPAQGSFTNTAFEFRNKKIRFKLSNVGSGITQILMNACKIILNDENIVLIEEPEIHIHADTQRKLFQFLKEQAKYRQIFLTTHSTIFTDVESNESSVKTFIIDIEDGTTKYLPILSKESLKSIKNIIGLKNKDNYTHDYVILVEGETEEVALPIIAKSMNSDLLSKGIGLINVGGKDGAKVDKIRKYLKWLENQDVTKFIILDPTLDSNEIIQGLVRESLIKNEHASIWKSGEFEECFGHDILIKAVKELTGLDINKETLQERKSQSKPITKILNDILRENGLPEISKPKLGETLGTLLSEEIKSTIGREKTEVENVLSEIFKYTS